LPVINSSLDSPIATADCISDQQRTGSGDFEFRDILQDVSCFAFSYVIMVKVLAWKIRNVVADSKKYIHRFNCTYILWNLHGILLVSNVLV